MSTEPTSPLLPPEHKLRPEVEWSLRRGAEKMRLLGAFPLLGIIVQAGVPVREVPSEYWREATDLQGHAQAVIDCPCGHRPVIDLGAYPTQCQCQRWFFYGGTRVLALDGPESDHPAS